MGGFLRACVLGLVVALGAAGCGASDGGAGAGRALPSATSSQSAHPLSTPAEGFADEQAVRDTYVAYQEALLAKDGEKAVGHVAASAFDFYDEMRGLALDATAEVMDEKPISQQATVLAMRAEFPAEVLSEASARDIVVRSVERGLIGESGVRQTSLTTVDVQGDRASAEMWVGGRDSGMRMPFLRDGAGWKIDLVSYLALFDPGFAEAARSAGMEPEEFVKTALEERYGAERIPLLRKPLRGASQGF